MNDLNPVLDELQATLEGLCEVIKHFQSENTRLKAKLKKAEKALRFYKEDIDGDLAHCGRIARDTLKEIGDE